MKIIDIKTYIVNMQLRRSHTWAGNTQKPLGRHLFVKIETDQGISGWGESPAIPTWGGAYGRHSGETPDTAKLLIERVLKPALLGEDPRLIAQVHTKLDLVAKGNPYAKVGIDIACHDIAGRASNLPVWALLGGKFRDEVELCQSLGLLSIDECVEEAVAVQEEGVTTIKVKTGLSTERDIEVVRRIREAVGDDLTIRVDANEGYSDRGEAVRATIAQEEYGIAFTEQPMMGVENLSYIAKRVGVPVMADESAWSDRDLLDLRDADAAAYFACYTAKPGGLYRARRQGELGELLGFSCDVGGSVELGVGSAANLHLAASLKNASLASVIPVNSVPGYSSNQVAGVYYVDDIITAPHEIKGGKIRVPTAPGLGVDVDEEKLVHHSEEYLESKKK